MLEVLENALEEATSRGQDDPVGGDEPEVLTDQGHIGELCGLVEGLQGGAGVRAVVAPKEANFWSFHLKIL